jgi:hypothetical protein
MIRDYMAAAQAFELLAKKARYDPARQNGLRLRAAECRALAKAKSREPDPEPQQRDPGFKSDPH